MGGFLSAAASKLLGGGPIVESECSNIKCCSTSQVPNVYDPRLGTMPTGWDRGVSEGSAASEISRTPFRFRRKKQAMTTIYVDSRKRVSGSDASATYVEAQNSIEVASDGNRRILSDAELLNLFPNGPGYPPGAYATRPQTINHLLGGSYLDGALQIFPWVSMNSYNEVYLRSRELGNAAHILGPLGNDIICKVIIDKGVGHVMKDQTDDGHLVELRGPITLRTLNFRLTDVDGNEVNTRGTSVSFAIFIDPEK